VQPRATVEAYYWNSFSRVDIGKPTVGRPRMWGISGRHHLAMDPISQRWMKIDGLAGTGMYEFSGDPMELGFLEYDVTNLAYSIRNRGRAAVIGVGGGRDVLSAHHYGFASITGVELNPIFIKNLTDRYADFNQVASVAGVRLVVDEARSWFARTEETFDLIQMSLIDTWAATGAGAFSLSENGLYTVEGWKQFLGRLTPDGVFTVSRWYAPTNPGETGRLVSLAKATLFDLGIADPNQHLFLAASQKLSTLVVSRAPLTEEERTRLRTTTRQLDFKVLLDLDQPPADAVLRAVFAAGKKEDLLAIPNELNLDLSPPTDARPFFFNQLRLSAIPAFFMNPPERGGVLYGNLAATAVLAVIIVMSLMAVLLTIAVPTLPTLRRVAARLTFLGTAYFLLIGLGFMFVEIGLMQRLSIFLGHPVYGLAIALAGIILAAGIGSALSERFPLRRRRAISTWSSLTVAYLVTLPLWFPAVVQAFAGAGTAARGAIALAAVLPAGIGLGFGFPTGMRLVNAIDERATPWFWAVNGAAGVLASGLAVATGTFISINASLWAAGLCYLLITPVAAGLLVRKPDLR